MLLLFRSCAEYSGLRVNQIQQVHYDAGVYMISGNWLIVDRWPLLASVH